MKGLIYLLGLAVVGVIVYKVFFEKKDQSIVTTPPTNPELQQDPAHKYGLNLPADLRVDGADQPWYHGSENIFGKVTDFSELMNESSVSDVGSFWETLNSNYEVH